MFSRLVILGQYLQIKEWEHEIAASILPSKASASSDLSSDRPVLREITCSFCEDGLPNGRISMIGTGIDLDHFRNPLLSAWVMNKTAPKVFHDIGSFDDKEDLWAYFSHYLWPGKLISQLSSDDQYFLRRLYDLLRGRLV